MPDPAISESMDLAGKPDFLVIGAQKSASSFLQICLADHPGIFMPHGETPCFESPDYEDGAWRDLPALFASAPRSAVTGLRRASYLAEPEVPARLKRHLPGARLIAVLRHPADRAISGYFHNAATGFLPPRNIEEGMRAILDGRWTGRWPRSAQVVTYGHYGAQLDRYLALFDRKQLLVQLHDDYCANSRACIAQAYAFLGVDPAYVSSKLHLRPQTSLSSLPRLWFRFHLLNRLKYTYDANRTRLRKPGPTAIRRGLLEAASRFDTAVLARLFPDRRPQLSGELRRRLLDLYEEDTRSVERLLSRELPGWRQ
jgi:hypothetical protein